MCTDDNNIEAENEQINEDSDDCDEEGIVIVQKPNTVDVLHSLDVLKKYAATTDVPLFFNECLEKISHEIHKKNLQQKTHQNSILAYLRPISK